MVPRLALGDLLDVDVEGDDDVGAVLGGLLHVGSAGDRRAADPGLEDTLAVLAREDVVVLELEPREALAVGAHEAQHLAGHGAVGVHALHVGKLVEAGELLLGERGADLVGHRGVHLPPHVDEGGVLGEVREVVLGRAAEVVGEHLGHGLGVGDLLGVGVERAALHRGGQDVAVAVVDGAALGLERHRVGAVCLGLRRQTRAVDDGQPQELAHREHREGRHEEERHTHALEEGGPAAGRLLVRGAPEAAVAARGPSAGSVLWVVVPAHKAPVVIGGTVRPVVPIRLKVRRRAATRAPIRRLGR